MTWTTAERPTWAERLCPECAGEQPPPDDDASADALAEFASELDITGASAADLLADRPDQSFAASAPHRCTGCGAAFLAWTDG